MKVPLEKSEILKLNLLIFILNRKNLCKQSFFTTSHLDQLFDFWVKSEYLCISLH